MTNIIKQSGFVTLTSVILIAAMSVGVSVTILLSGINSSRTSFSYQELLQAKALADACAEEALQQIRDNSSYTGSGSLSLGQGSCNYNVQSTGGENRTITVDGTIGTIVRRASITIDAINPSINITTWSEY
tara:strand:+ start:594 stop:986 length:393 start_codon:yes stop_codon:yes gene_type:complete